VTRKEVLRRLEEMMKRNSFLIFVLAILMCLPAMATESNDVSTGCMVDEDVGLAQNAKDYVKVDAKSAGQLTDFKTVASVSGIYYNHEEMAANVTTVCSDVTVADSTAGVTTTWNAAETTDGRNHSVYNVIGQVSSDANRYTNSNVAGQVSNDSRHDYTCMVAVSSNANNRTMMDDATARNTEKAAMVWQTQHRQSINSADDNQFDAKKCESAAETYPTTAWQTQHRYPNPFAADTGQVMDVSKKKESAKKSMMSRSPVCLSDRMVA